MPDRADLRLLVFRLAALTCAADVTRVREVLPWQVATRVPGAAPAVGGLINVRGALVPLIDGRRALGQAPTAGGVIVLLEVGDRPVGFGVDEVIDLITLRAADWADRSTLPGVDPRVVRAVGRRDGQAVLVLDLDALLEPLLTVERSDARRQDAGTPSGR